MYATVSDLRAEGVAENLASDARLESLIQEATAFIDHATNWWFEPRVASFRLDGRGTPSIEPAVPPIRIDSIRVNDLELSIDPDDLVVVGAPVQPGFCAPRITRRSGRFLKGQGNVEIEALWGYTEPDGSLEGRVPREIRRLCMMLVMSWIPPLSSGDADEQRHAWRVTNMRTRDQSVSFANPGMAGHYIADPDIDRIVRRYRRPMGLGAA